MATVMINNYEQRQVDQRMVTSELINNGLLGAGKHLIKSSAKSFGIGIKKGLRGAKPSKTGSMSKSGIKIKSATPSIPMRAGTKVGEMVRGAKTAGQKFRRANMGMKSGGIGGAALIGGAVGATAYGMARRRKNKK